MARQSLGITYTVPAGQEPKGIYEDPNGILSHVVEGPYLLDDERTLATPLPVFDVGGPTYQDADGNLQKSLAVSGEGVVPPAGITWDNNTTWDNGTYWS